VVTRPLKVERRTVSVRRPKTGVPPTVLRNQPYTETLESILLLLSRSLLNYKYHCEYQL